MALRLALQVVGSPNLPVQPLQLPTTPGTSGQQQQQQLGRRLVTSGTDASAAAAAAAAAAQQQSHSFELGIHLNLTQLMGLPSTRHGDKLSAERAGFGSAARGVLLIGDLGLEPDDLAAMPWRPPPLGIGVVAASQQQTAPAVVGAAAVTEVVVEEGSGAQPASGSRRVSSKQQGKEG